MRKPCSRRERPRRAHVAAGATRTQALLKRPAGLLVILAVVMLANEISAQPGKLWVVAIASAVTIATHLFAGRRALLSIFAGTTVYIVLLNFF